MIKRINRWVIPIALGCGLVAGLLWAFLAYVRLRPPPPGAKGALKPAIALVSAAQQDKERRELTDLDPLFLPTRHNTSVLHLPAQVRREPGSMSFTFPPKLSELESRNGVPITEKIPIPTHPIEVLELGEPPPAFPELGRADVLVPQLPPRLAVIEISEARSGRVVLSQEVPLSPEVKPPTADWIPVQFLIAIDAAGIVGSPVVTNSSTSEEVESFFSDFLAKKFSVGARLTPGFYTVHVGP